MVLEAVQWQRLQAVTLQRRRLRSYATVAAVEQ